MKDKSNLILKVNSKNIVVGCNKEFFKKLQILIYSAELLGYKVDAINNIFQQTLYFMKEDNDKIVDLSWSLNKYGNVSEILISLLDSYSYNVISVVYGKLIKNNKDLFLAIEKVINLLR